MKSWRAVAEFVPLGAYAIDWRQLSTAFTTAGSVKLYLPPLSQSAPDPITQLAISTTMFGCSAVIVASPKLPLLASVVAFMAASHSSGDFGGESFASFSFCSL